MYLFTSIEAYFKILGIKSCNYGKGKKEILGTVTKF